MRIAVLSSLFVLIFSGMSLHAVTPPRSTDPGRINQQLTKPELEPKQSDIDNIDVDKRSDKSDANEATFVLKRVILDDETAFNEQQLQSLYQQYIDQPVRLADLQAIAQIITNAYRKQGYVLSTAIIPSQRVADGIVHIQIIEGYIDSIEINEASDISPAMVKRVLRTGEFIKDQRPLNIKDLERYMLLLNDLPGTTARSVLQPSQTQGAAQMMVIAESRMLDAFAGVNNFGTRYIGPVNINTGFSVNNILASGSRTSLTSVRSSDGEELIYYGLAHNQALGYSGLNLSVVYGFTSTNPDFSSNSDFNGLQVRGKSQNAVAMLTYPLIRSRENTLLTTLEFAYLNSKTTINPGDTLEDRIRSLRVGGHWNFIDRFRANNNLTLRFSKGIKFLNATSNIETTSGNVATRSGGRPDYAKVELNVDRQQWITPAWSVYTALASQYDLFHRPLLASEEFGIGGRTFGRGYDAAEVIGDHGLAGSLELRYTHNGQGELLDTAQLYGFYDVGSVWQVGSNVGRASVASAGFGARVRLLSHIYGQVEWAQPLTKAVSAESNGHAPRVFFTLSAFL